MYVEIGKRMVHNTFASKNIKNRYRKAAIDMNSHIMLKRIIKES